METILFLFWGDILKKRYAFLLFTVISTILIFIIFKITLNNNIYYLALGDYLTVGNSYNSNSNKSYSDYIADNLKDKEKLYFYTKGFANSNYRNIELLNDIKNNKRIKVNNKEITLKNALIKADIVTLSIGMNDLFYKINFSTDFSDDYILYKYVDEVISDMDKLLLELRTSCKEEIIVTSFYNPFINTNLFLSTEPIIEYANSKLLYLLRKYDMKYFNINKIFSANPNYLSYDLKLQPNNASYYAIYKQILKIINNKKLAK